MKKLFIGILLAGLVACQAGSAQGQSPAAQWTTARQWNKGVVGWNLGNQLECSAPGQDGETLLIGCPEGSLKAETAWGNPVVTEKTIQAVKEAGFNAVRIPVRWQCHIVNEQAMVVDKEWIARVKQVVDWCLKYDLKVILNTHHEKWLESRPTYAFQEENCRKLSLLWLQIATEFEGYDARLAFAGTNEVHIRDNWGAPTAENLDVQNAYNQVFVDMVRSTGGNNARRHLIVQTYVCNPEFGLDGKFVVPQDSPRNGNRFMSVEFHFYDPWDYCGEGTADSWNDVARLMGLFDRAAAQWSTLGLGVVIGEWGVTDHGKNLDAVRANTRVYCRTYVSEALKRGFSSFVWDNNSFGVGADKFGIFNRFKGMKLQASWVMQGILEAKNAE